MKSFHARTPRPPVPATKSPMPSAPLRVDHGDEARVDSLLVSRGLAPSRSAAQHLIDAGRVYCETPAGWQPVTKAAHRVAASAALRVSPPDEVEDENV